jgi:hypothetical protein
MVYAIAGRRIHRAQVEDLEGILGGAGLGGFSNSSKGYLEAWAISTLPTAV